MDLYDLIEKVGDVIFTVLVILLAPIVFIAGLVWLAASWGVVFNVLGI